MPGAGSAPQKYGACDEDFVARLRGVCKDVRTDEEALEEGSMDHSVHDACRPDAVAFPETKEEVQEIVRLCARFRVPIVPRGAGTGLEGGALPIRGGVVVDVMGLRMIDVRRKDLVLICGPGWYKLEINQMLEKEGLLLGSDPASNPSVGGMAATAGSGLAVLRYGTSRENIVSLQVVLPNGELVETKRLVRKSSAGYDLTQLFAGSEGTLGIIVQMAWRVYVKPKQRVGLLFSFEDILTAANCVVAFRYASPVTLARCECLNAEGIKATNKLFKTVLPEKPTLFLQFESDSLEHMTAEARHFEEIAREHGCLMNRFVVGDAIDDLWEARRGCYHASKAYRGRKDDKVYPGDACVPLSELPGVISASEKIASEWGFAPIMCCHIADGNFHLTIPFAPEEKSRLLQMEAEVIKIVLGVGGTCTGEHGVGVGKMKFLVSEHGEAHVNVMRQIKRAIDPLNVMNPGKIFELEPLQANM